LRTGSAVTTGRTLAGPVESVTIRVTLPPGAARASGHQIGCSELTGTRSSHGCNRLDRPDRAVSTGAERPAGLLSHRPARQPAAADSSPGGTAVVSCWLCGIHMPADSMMADGGSACGDVRWYCEDTRSCTWRWTARPADVATTVAPARGGPACDPAAAGVVRPGLA